MSFRKYQNRKDWKFKKCLGAIKAKDLTGNTIWYSYLGLNNNMVIVLIVVRFLNMVISHTSSGLEKGDWASPVA
jgi:hypothetical protein